LGKKGGLWWKIVLVVLLLLFVFVALLPTLVSIGFKGTVSGTIGNASGAESEIRGLSLSWLGSQSIEGIMLYDEAGAPVVIVDKIEAGVSLLSLVTGSMDLGTTTITGLDVRVTLDEGGGSNLQTLGGDSDGTETEGGAPSSTPVSLPPDLAVGLKVVDAKVSIKQAGRDEVKVEGLDFSVDLKADGSPIVSMFEAAVSQADLAGAIEGRAEVTGLIGEGGVVDKENALLDVTAQTRDLPVAGVDRLLGQNGLLIAALGDRLSLIVGAQGALDRPTVYAELDSWRASVLRWITRPSCR
jgi:uncharacterized protein involved in outer membrane biogenesis